MPAGQSPADGPVSGEFVTVEGERYYVVRNADRMPPFFISVISSADHWLFVSSSGGLTAGRVSPETALFPYAPVDRIHDSDAHTGCRTILRVGPHGRQAVWEPFNRQHDGRFDTVRNLYKSVLGDKLRFEEVNHDLGLVFRYTWATSDRYGFVRSCELENLGDPCPAGVPVQAVHHGVELEVLPAGQPAVERGFLENDADRLPDLIAARRDVVTRHLGLA